MREKDGKAMMYYVIEYRNIGMRGMPRFVETIKLATPDKHEASRFEDELRKTYKDRTMVDCFIRTEEEMGK